MLLTIAIPTYNRRNYLKLCLTAIIEQLNLDCDLINFIDIVILDNDSNDDTSDVVYSLIQANPQISIRYIKNNSNIGLDGNITKSFEVAKGNFVWVFGDDDVLIPGSLKHIISVLKENLNCGNIYVNHYGFIENYQLNIPVQTSFKYDVYLSKIAYFFRVNYYFTYTTGNIVNKKKLPIDFNIPRFLGTNLNLLNWIFTAIFRSEYNIVIEDKLIAMKIENTGGYGFCETFAKNGNYIFAEFIKDGISKKYFNIINNKMLTSFFPRLIFAAKNNHELKFTKENYLEVLEKVYRNNFRFWLFCRPIITSKNSAKKLFLFFNSAYNKLSSTKLKIYRRFFLIGGRIKKDKIVTIN